MSAIAGETRRARRPRLFHGWVVVAGTFLVLCMGFGIAYSFAAFFVSLQDEFGATRSQVSLVFAITGFLYFSLGAISGPAADRIGPRRVVLAGVVLIGVGLLLASRAQTLWQVYLTYSLGVGIGVGFVYVPAIGAVQRWFLRRRGFASGLAVSGIGIGTLAVPPLAATLIARTDWRTAYVVFAVVILVGGAGAALLIEHSPQRRGLEPDGGEVRVEPPPAGMPERARRVSGSVEPVAAASPWSAPSRPGEPQTAEQGGTVGVDPPLAASLSERVWPAGGGVDIAGGLSDSVSTREAVRSRPFLLLYIATVATSLGLFIPFAHLAAYARDHGLSEFTGATLVGLIGGGSAVGRLALGGMADRLGRRRSLSGAFGGMCVMLLWWLGASSTWALAVFAVLFGACYGGFVALVPALTTDYFGGRNAGGIIGLLYTGAGLGALIGPYVAGVVYDLRESYALPIAFGAAANLVAVACMVTLADPVRWRSARTAVDRRGA